MCVMAGVVGPIEIDQKGPGQKASFKWTNGMPGNGNFGHCGESCTVAGSVKIIGMSG